MKQLILSKTKPYDHQYTQFVNSKDVESEALFWDMGTGKTKICIDKGVYLYRKNLIELIVFIAPNGVHSDHINLAVPTHAGVPTEAMVYNRKQTKQQLKLNETFLRKNPEKLKIIAFNTDCVRPGTFSYKFLVKTLTHFKCLGCVDESSDFKTHNSARTKGLLGLSSLMDYKICMDGTPITTAPSDLYPIVKFLRPDLLCGMSYWCFRAKFEKLHNPQLKGTLCGSFGKADGGAIYEYFRTKGYPPKTFLKQLLRSDSRAKFAASTVARQFMYSNGVRNLDQLQILLKKFSTVLKKEDCLDLPEKIFTQHIYNLSPNLKSQYNELLDNMIVETVDGQLSATNVLTLYLRLQQLISTSDRVDELRKIINKIPTTSKVVIFARFKDNIRYIRNDLQHQYGDESVVTYYGENTLEEKNLAKVQFAESESCRFFLSNVESGGLGLNLISANYMIFFNKNFNYRLNIQAIDRIYRIGQTKSCTIVSIHCADTIDERIKDNLGNKQNLSSTVLSTNEINNMKMR